MANAINMLEGTLVFVQVDKPISCFNKEKGAEWKASIVVSEDDADNWEEAYPKQSAKAVKTSEFKEIYKIDPPYPEQKKQFIITLRKNTLLGNGNEVPDKYKPKVFEEVKNGTLVDITHSKLVGNGSVGAISVDTWSMDKGMVARLKNIKVTELIEYVKEASGDDYEPGDEFGSSTKAAPKADKPAAKKPKVQEPEDESDSPF